MTPGRHGVIVDVVGRVARRTRVLVAAHPMAGDVTIAAVLLAMTAVAVRLAIDAAPPGTYDTPSTAAWLTIVVALTLPLALRRRFPLSVLVAVTIANFFVSDIRELGMSIIIYWVALYSAGAYGRPGRRDWVRALSVLVVLGTVLDRLGIDGFTGRTAVLNTVFLVGFHAFFDAAAWIAGDTMAARRATEASLQRRAAELQREREENARRAVFDERVRIARELHDVIAHHVSVMGVQAGAARRVMSRQPDKAEEVLTAIEAGSRQAVVELQRMLGFLRRDDEVDELAPQPGLDQLDELARRLRQAKLEVDVDVEGEPRPLPRSLDVSAYRIVQEALTNTLKHGAASSAVVRVRYRAKVIEVDVVDDGHGDGHEPAPGSGHGLIGMRERVTLHGGHLRAGPRPEGGFAVHAELPLNGRR